MKNLVRRLTLQGTFYYLSQVGEGTLGKVYKALNTLTNVHVALGRMRIEAEKDGQPLEKN